MKTSSRRERKRLFYASKGKTRKIADEHHLGEEWKRKKERRALVSMLRPRGEKRKEELAAGEESGSLLARPSTKRRKGKKKTAPILSHAP